MKKEINVGIVGTQFMGKAHTNAYLDVGYYFDLPAKPVMRAACDLNAESLDTFAKKYGWQTQETSWQKMIERDDIDLVDICTPNFLHAPIAIAAAKAGKHVICEKPIAMNAAEAKKMHEAASEAGVRNMVAFNYRRVPALALAKQLIQKGKIGRVHHFNAVYYQDWLVDPSFPMVWRHDAKVAGSGANGDLNAHIVDQARFLVGEIEAVCGDQQIFIKERPIAGGVTSAIINTSQKGAKKTAQKMGTVTADDATCFLARFRDGAIGSFIGTRFATGHKNFMRIEIFGSEGSIAFNLERLNELEYYSRNDDSAEQGFRNIMVTESIHPYIKAWWPPGHVIGWEHTFIHEVSDMLTAIAKNKPVTPDFYDGFRCQQVLDAVSDSANNNKWVKIP